jgi:ribosome recycling factor
LVIDVFDKANKQLIWEGIATKTVDENPDTRDKNIPIAVAKLMRYYPVPPIKGEK